MADQSNAVLPVEGVTGDPPESQGVPRIPRGPKHAATRPCNRGPSRRVHARARAQEVVHPDAPARTYRLMTTITDPNAAPASEFARIYTQRWEIETAFAELKTHQRSPGLVLRSKMPDGVIQEVYGYLCVHYAIDGRRIRRSTPPRPGPALVYQILSGCSARSAPEATRVFPPDALADADRCVTTEILRDLRARRAAPTRESSVRRPSIRSNTATTATRRSSNAESQSCRLECILFKVDRTPPTALRSGLDEQFKGEASTWVPALAIMGEGVQDLSPNPRPGTGGRSGRRPGHPRYRTVRDD